MPKDHPLRPIRELVNAALAKLDEDFNKLYADRGRASTPLRSCFAPSYY